MKPITKFTLVFIFVTMISGLALYFFTAAPAVQPDKVVDYHAQVSAVK